MFDGVGLLGCVFVLVLMWDAWKDWKRACVMRDRRRNQLPYSTGRRRPARGFFGKSRVRLALLVIVSGLTAMLVGGRQIPHGAKIAPSTPAGTLNPAAGKLSSGKDSNRVAEAILTYQTLPPTRGAGGSAVKGGSNVIAPSLGNKPDATDGPLNHP
ncbi:MAG TPA: hypothetical protein VJT54_15765 [Verrucomicrobiae bacterium]|nr:hypothetical protein [Verrucomicrobiae bacterium]